MSRPAPRLHLLESMSAELSTKSTQLKREFMPSAQPLRPLCLSGDSFVAKELPRSLGSRQDLVRAFAAAIARRVLRERRRRKVGRAYDMALEIARVIPRNSEVLDVGCGNGFIAHHLSGLLGTGVTGIDLADSTEAAIDYRHYDGRSFPAGDASCDAVLSCYVLHHAQDLSAMLSEMRRVLRVGGLAVIYEDIPDTLWDRFICWTHNLKWKNRTGPCAFRNEEEWRALFSNCGFEIVSERQLSRLRNLMHPVARRFYVLRQVPFAQSTNPGHSEARPANLQNPLSVWCGRQS